MELLKGINSKLSQTCNCRNMEVIICTIVWYIENINSDNLTQTNIWNCKFEKNVKFIICSKQKIIEQLNCFQALKLKVKDRVAVMQLSRACIWIENCRLINIFATSYMFMLFRKFSLSNPTFRHLYSFKFTTLYSFKFIFYSFILNWHMAYLFEEVRTSHYKTLISKNHLSECFAMEAGFWIPFRVFGVLPLRYLNVFKVLGRSL